MADFFKNGNNVLTMIGTGVAAIAAIFSAYNAYRINNLDTRTKIEDASYRFAAEFLNRVGSPPGEGSSNGGDVNKRANFRAMLPALDIIGQASSDATGRSSADARGVLPLYMALILGEPGAAAGMDPDLKKLKWWLAMASVDDKNTTRLTAIQALSAICRRALIDGQLNVVVRGIEAIDQLLELIPDEESLETKNLRMKALTAKTVLVQYLQKRAKSLDAATFSKDSEILRAKLKEALVPATDALWAAEKELTAKVKESPDATRPEVLADSKRTLAVTETVFATARKDVLDQPPKGASVGPLSVAPPAKRLGDLIAMLANKDAQERQKASVDLALVGQDAVKRLVKEVETRQGKESEEDKNVRLGVAVALSRMRQPISIDSEDAKWVTSLLGVPEKDTRKAAADFLMDLWSGASIRAAFKELEAKFNPEGDPGSGYHVNYYVAQVVGTWARNLDDTITAADPGEKMNDVALEKAREWRTALETSQQRDKWKQTIQLLDDLIVKATKKVKMVAKVETTLK